MAIARTGPLIGGISGRLGCSEIAMHGSQLVIKVAKQTTDRCSIRQSNARNDLSDAHTAWANLPPGPNQAWHLFASQNTLPNRLGTQRPLAATAWFAKWYGVARYATPTGIAYLRPPPGNRTTPAPSGIVVKAEHPSTLTVQTIGTWPDDGTAFEQLLVSPLSNYSQESPRNFISIGWQVKTDDTTDWSTLLAAADLELLEGARCAVRLRWCWHMYWASGWTPGQAVVT